MVRRKVEIKAIEDKSKRHTTFTKRRQGLFKKTKEFCDKCEADAAVITFSKAGNAFAFGHPAVDNVLGRYFADPTSHLAKKHPRFVAAQERVHGGGRGIKKAPPQTPEVILTEAEKRISDAMVDGGAAWDVVVEDLQYSELDELEGAIKELQSEVVARAEEVAAAEACEKIEEGELDGGDPGSWSLGI